MLGVPPGAGALSSALSYTLPSRQAEWPAPYPDPGLRLAAVQPGARGIHWGYLELHQQIAGSNLSNLGWGQLDWSRGLGSDPSAGYCLYPPPWGCLPMEPRPLLSLSCFTFPLAKLGRLNLHAGIPIRAETVGNEVHLPNVVFHMAS